MSAKNTIMLIDDISSLIRRRRIVVHESESESEASEDEVSVTIRDVLSKVVDLLTNNPFIKELYGITIFKIDAKRFLRNFRRLLIVYCQNSKRNAYTRVERVTIQFIQQKSHQIAQNIYDRITIPIGEAESSIDL
jgi:hypothetical protein